ncbi:hypothetical protein SLEP1_g21679 [Rubroshorea leprosula]|uniref:Uncharacterized protein n=1 Tax=Rubroshorea leprosula TaxID=152421 RepID=A0AAV5JCT4_9ROSI|nr:hypothetical protein SLEP1_g21679 [Rubroshorea leprosula]
MAIESSPEVNREELVIGEVGPYRDVVRIILLSGAFDVGRSLHLQLGSRTQSKLKGKKKGKRKEKGKGEREGKKKKTKTGINGVTEY